jgi:hypothetical protein
MTRTDIHRPSAINPADYVFIAYDYYGPHSDGMQFDRLAFHRHREQTGGTFSSHDHGGSCHVCGATALFVAKFYHAKTNTYVVTGEDCAEKMGMGDPAAFRRFRDSIGSQREALAGKAKAKTTLEAAGHGEAWAVYVSDRGNGDRQVSWEESTLRDIVGKLVKYGSISDKQMDFIGRLLVKLAQAPVVAAARVAEEEAAAPVPTTDARVAIEGTILTIKQQESQFGVVTKMLVKHADGWKVWGTVPSAISGVDRGARVRFVAGIQRSDRDPKFGFFTRPAKAEVLEEAA